MPSLQISLTATLPHSLLKFCLHPQPTKLIKDPDEDVPWTVAIRNSLPICSSSSTFKMKALRGDLLALALFISCVLSSEVEIVRTKAILRSVQS